MLTAADLFALDQRSRFSSYTQYDDAAALQRSFQCAPQTARLAYEERAAAILDEVDRANTKDDSLVPAAGDEENK